jgi:class 3 adenylate cyclase/tetratricopeptide (TPR) repeat protein
MEVERVGTAGRAGGSGQRRYVTVLFADVSDSSAHAELLEQEDYSELLADFRRIAREVVPRHGGSIARLQGDGLLALFGHLEPREDDGRRATEAALELHEQVAQLRAGSGLDAKLLQMHSGIHAGLVLVIEGDIERGRFDVVGEVPNTAARLCSLAATGQILVSEETLGPQAHFFQVAQLPHLPIRGRAAPLNVLRIEGRAAAERRFDAAARRGVVPFIGRENTMAALLQAAERAQRGESPAILVSGEPGIGKTRLLEEFQRRLDARAFRVLKGYCESYLGAEPLQPFLQCIRGALGRPPGLAPPQDSDTPGDAKTGSNAAQVLQQSLLGPGGGKGMPSPSKLIEAIMDLIAVLARDKTLVLVLDDWQWADDASRTALATLLAPRKATLEPRAPMLVLLASRPAPDLDNALPGVRTVQLHPFDVAESAKAIAASLPAAEPFVIQEIHRQSGGTPLFIEELCHAAIQGDFHATTPRASVAWINSLVASRLSRLPEAEADCLRAASVAGNVFPDWLLQRVIGESDAGPRLERLCAADFLVPAGEPGMVRFKHVLTRDAVYATVAPNRRRALHLRVAEVLEQSAAEDHAFESLEALSYHYDAAGVSAKAAHYAQAAGDKSLAAMALDRARAQYVTVLRSLDALPALDRELKLRWCAVAEKLGQTCVFDPLDVAQGLLLFQRAAQLAEETGDENALARAEYWLAYVNYGRGRAREAVRHGEIALEHALGSDDQRLVAQVEATLGQSLASAGQYERALPLLSHAVESKRQQSRIGSGAAIGSAYSLGRTGYTLGDLGRFEEAHEAFAESLRLLGDKEHSVGASIRELICAVHLWQGRWEEAHAMGMEGAAIALRCRSRYLTAMGRALGSCGGWALRRDQASLQMLRDSTQWIEDRGGAVSTSLNYGWLVEATASLGQEAQARRYAARLFQRARAHDRHGQAMGCRALAGLAAAQGDIDAARHYLRLADSAAARRGSAREQAVNDLARAGLHLQLRQPADARGLAEKAGQRFEAMKMDWHAAQARALLACL